MITVGQIGVGYWGPNLLRNLNSNDDCNVKIVADLSKDRREFVEKSYPNVFVTDDVNNIFNDQDIDAVIHTASPFSAYEPKDEQELIKPAREGTIRVLTH